VGLVDAEEVFEVVGGEGSERGWEGGAGEGGLGVVEAEIAGGGAGAGVVVDAGGVVRTFANTNAYTESVV
jgi:hypothetical protein